MRAQARRPAGTPVGGQFAPINRPEATGSALLDDSDVLCPTEPVQLSFGFIEPLATQCAPAVESSPQAYGVSPTTDKPTKHYRQANTLRHGSQTPWGAVDSYSHWDVGITEFGTPGHGGIKLSAERNKDVHEAWRRDGGWYEEDCEWAIIPLTFPECYPPERVSVAREVARDWLPDEYETVTGEQIQPGESYIRDEQLFSAAHEQDWVSTGGLSVEPMDGVPMVKVWARVGGRESGSTEARAFLVPESDYKTRERFGFVVDPNKYEEVEP